MDAIEPGYLKRLERWTLVLAALVTGASLVAAPRPVAVAVAIGAAMMCGNAWAIRTLTARVFKSRAGATPGIGVLLFNVKMALLVGLVCLALFYLRLDGVGFLIGISVFPVAIVAAALAARLEPMDPEGPESPKGPKGPKGHDAPGGPPLHTGFAPPLATPPGTSGDH